VTDEHSDPGPDTTGESGGTGAASDTEADSGGGTTTVTEDVSAAEKVSNTTARDETGADPTPEPGPDEAFCVECGSVIKQRAEICPECGVRQTLESHPPGADGPAGATQQPPADGPAGATQQPPGQAPARGRGQGQSQAPGAQLTERRQYELERLASKDKGTVVVVGLLLTPLAYWMVDRKLLAVLNFITFNFLFMGFLIVPIHCYSIIENAEGELRRAGVEGY